jgi:capsular exopolysaccharide synthesis family protein
MLLHGTDNSASSLRALPPAGQRSKNSADTEREALFAMLRGLRRNVRLITLTTLIGSAIVAATVLFGLTPQYRATATILFDSRKTEILKDREVVARPGSDSSAVESEAELIKSPAILRIVAEQLHLHEDGEFMASGSLISWVKWLLISPFDAVFGDGGDQAQPDRLARAVNRLERTVHAARRNQTYVIELSAWARSGPKAAMLANKIAEVYLADQLGTKAAATRQATRWLNEEVEQLRTRLIASENSYEAYKAEAGLFSPGGLTLADSQIAQLNEQLVMARARAAEAQAKFDQLRHISADKLHSGASSPDVLESSVLTNLRNLHAEAARKHAELTARYGTRHPQVVSVKAEISNLSKQIEEELERIVASAKTEVEMAKSRQASLSASLEELKIGATEFNRKAVKLRELEREVEANRALFDAFLARAKETGAQLSLLLPDSRILSAASVPLAPSFPRKGMMIGFGFFGSLGAGIFLALIRGMLSEGFQRAGDLQSALGLNPLATIPAVEPKTAQALMRLSSVPQRTGATRLTRLPPDPANAEACRLASLVVSEPNSAFAESIHALHFALRQMAAERQINVLLIASALPDEGKSTVAANLARAASMYGEHVLLIDPDLRRPSLAMNLALPPSPGLVAAARRQCDLQSAIVCDHATPLHVMAGATRLSGPEALTLLASAEPPKLIAELRPHYDLILIDTAPLLPVADSRFLVGLADAVALVVASEQTSRTAVKAALQETPGLEEKILGAIMNRVARDFFHDYPEYRSFHKVA